MIGLREEGVDIPTQPAVQGGHTWKRTGMSLDGEEQVEKKEGSTSYGQSQNIKTVMYGMVEEN